MTEKNIRKIKNMLNNKNGITLIALVITIIVMLILVAVTISMAINGGLFGYAGKATSDTEKAKQDELKIAEGQIEVEGKKYDSPEDFIAGIESGSTPKYSPSLLDSTTKVLTKTAEYTDANDDIATIPKGYGIVEGLDIINQGLVISDAFDSNGNSIGNEFVWIPVPEKNMKVATLSDQYVGKTYYAEPKLVSYDTQANINKYYGTKEDSTTPYFTLETDFALEANYREMAESVNEYGGFYIGRYETTIDSNDKIGSKYNTPILTAHTVIKEGQNSNDSNNPFYYRWWGLYYASRHSNVAENGNTVQTNMIWGQEWDKMISYFDSKSIKYAAISTSTYNKPSSVLSSGQATYTNKTDNTDVIKDVVFNIYDLRMNAYDWTAEAVYAYSRVVRGGYYTCSDSASDRYNSNPYNSNNYDCTRLTLYIR